MTEIKFMIGSIHIDWAARDREIKRQLAEGLINIEKIVAATPMKWIAK
jgi:hypothetical protein